jgi:5-formyltetrahydrofolate cyclo-ligase
MDSVPALRRKLAKRRRSLPIATRRKMNRSLCRHVLGAHGFRNARTIAAYFPFGAEPDLLPVLRIAHRQGKDCYLPRIRSDLALTFHRWTPDASLAVNRFGIPEPAPDTPARDTRFLDLVLTPLVGFDHHGNRIGMGAGFYDRTFAFRHRNRNWQGPLLIGTAWECQRADSIPAESWDVPLDGIVTESGWQKAAR